MKKLLAIAIAAAFSVITVPSFAADGDANQTMSPKAPTKAEKEKAKEEKAKAKANTTKADKDAKKKAKSADQAETLKNQEQTHTPPAPVDKSAPKLDKAGRAEASKETSKNPGKGQ
jgi:hypothetical protein